MSVFEKHRFKIFNNAQHPYQHTISDYNYQNARLPGVNNLNDALDYIIATMYPNYKGTVANPAALPGVATANDYYIVNDDGDGKSAGYVYSKIDSVEQWIKRYDVDWSFDNILTEAVDSTEHLYVHKYGYTDKDENATPYAGDLAGQHIYGGDVANQNLTFFANSGDAVGNTGYVQFGDNVRPLNDSSYSLGTTGYRWSNVWTDALTVATMAFATGSITDSSGAISFGNENLSTTGTLQSGTHTIGTMVVASGSITNTGGAIGFDDENLSTTGTLQSGTHTIGNMVVATGSITNTTGTISFDNEHLTTTGNVTGAILTGTSLSVDDININANTISIITLDTNLNLAANGTGIVNIMHPMMTLGQTVTGTVGITGILNVDNLRLDGNTFSSTNANGNILLAPNGAGEISAGATIFAATDNVPSLGKSGGKFLDLWMSGSINDGTNSFTASELMSLRDVVYRDVARTQPAQSGDSLFYDSVNGVWLANHPDTEITHSDLGGLTTTDAGHTQFAMLAGRAGGQALQGGTAASENLDLESTAHATKGAIRVKDNVIPFTNASYSGSWSGTDLGDGTHYLRHVYTKGEFKGFRFENYTTGTLPASSATAIGRTVFATDNEKLYVDNGSAFVAVAGTNKFVSDVAFNGVETVKNVDVSSEIADARNAICELLDNNNNFEKMFVKIEATSVSNIRITTNLALTAGSYRLIVME